MIMKSRLLSVRLEVGGTVELSMAVIQCGANDVVATTTRT
jgi:hypothetical protein